MWGRVYRVSSVADDDDAVVNPGGEGFVDVKGPAFNFGGVPV